MDGFNSKVPYLVLYFITKTLLASATLVFSQKYKILAEIRTDSCKNKVHMKCVHPAKLTCSRSCVQKNDGPFCIRCEIEIESKLPQIGGEIAAIHPNGSNIGCYNGYALHVNISNWEGDKLLDICANPLSIDKGYRPIIDASGTIITFSEYTSCKGLLCCPKKRYLSNTTNQGYGRYKNGANDCNSYEHRSTTNSAHSSDASRVTISHSMVVLALVLGITCRELMYMY